MQLQQRAAGDTEDLDYTPVEIPASALGPPSLEERLQQYVREQISAVAEEQGQGSFDEENDYEEEPWMDEDPELVSGYEVIDMLPEEDRSESGESDSVGAAQALEEALPPPTAEPPNGDSEPAEAVEPPKD